LGFLALILLLVLFHRPILRGVANWAAQHFATKAGYTLEGRVGGSILSDLSLPGLSVAGPEKGILQSLQWKDAEFEYSLAGFLKNGVSGMLRRVALSDAEIVLDLRHPAPPDPDKPKSEPGPPDNFWVDEIELNNVTVKVITPDGEILLEKLNLVLQEGREGEFSFESLHLPARGLHLTGVSSTTTVQDRWIRLRDFQITPEVVFRVLDVNLGELAQGRLPLNLDLQSGPGQLQAEGTLEGLGTALALDLKITAAQMGDQEIRRWVALPEGLAWEVEALALSITGQPSVTASLAGQLDLKAKGLVVAGKTVDHLQGRLHLDAGEWDLASLDLRAGTNTVSLNGKATVPPQWSQIARSAARFNFTLDAPDLATLMPGAAAFQGRLTGSGDVTVQDRRLGGANLKLTGSDLVIANVPLENLDALVVSDASTLTVQQMDVHLEGENRVRLSGTVALAGRQAADLTLVLDGADLSRLDMLKELVDVYPPASGTMAGTVKATFDVADLREKNFRDLRATGHLKVSGLQWNQGLLEEGSLDVTLDDEQVRLTRLDLILDTQNRASLTGTLGLAGDRPVEVVWDFDLQQVPSLTSWVQPESVNTLPPPQAGVLVSQGRATFTLAAVKAKDWSQATAEAALTLRDVQWLNASLEDATLKARMVQGRVTADSLQIRFDEANLVSLTGFVDPAGDYPFEVALEAGLTRLPDLSGWLELFNGPAIPSGSVNATWAGKGTLSPLNVSGNGKVAVADFGLEGNPNRYSLELETGHDGRKASLDRLVAQAGPFRLEASGSLSDTDLELKKLSLFSGKTSILSGEVAVPLVLTQTPRPKVPVDPDRPLRVKLDMNELKFEELFKAAGRAAPPVSGSASATVDLTGKLAELTGILDIKVAGVTAPALRGKLAPATATVTARLQPGQLQLDASVMQRPLQPLVIKASLPLALEEVLARPAVIQEAELSAEITLPPSDLGFVTGMFPALASVRGQAGLKVSLEGPLRRPRWQGALDVNVPSAELEKGAMSIRDAKARIVFADTKITLNEVSAVLAGGEIRATGGVDVADLAKPVVDVRVVARQALIVRDDTMSLRADGNLLFRGPVQEAAVSGRVELVRGRVFKEIEFLPLSLPNQLPPPPPPVRRSTGPPSAPAFFANWKLDVDVVTRDPVRLLGNVLNGAIVVNLHAGGTGGAPEVTGKANLENARVQLPFSRLAISRGDILFNKENPLEPQLDLQGDSLVGNYVVTVYAQGPALAPKVRFTSNPPLSEGEIATLLATGSTAGDLTASEGVAANRAAFLLLSQTYRKLFKKASPRRLDEEPPKLSFSFSPISSGTTQRAVTATYEISPKLQVVGEVGERGTFRGLLHYLVRFR
jgi:hypothetical protein